MSTARIRNYLKKNTELCSDWRDQTIRHEIIRRLIDEQGDNETPEFGKGVSSIYGNGNRKKIYGDMMCDHYGLGHVTSKLHPNGYSTESFMFYYDAFRDLMANDPSEAPTLEPAKGDDKVRECDVYTLINKMSLPNLIYVYNHQDEYVFINKWGKEQDYYTSEKILGLGILGKDVKDEADNQGFRNALNKYYKRRVPEVAKAMFGHESPDLKPNKREYGVADTFDTYNFVGAHKELLPEGLNELTSENLTKLVEMAEHHADIMNQTRDQLTSLRDSILEAEAAGDFEQQFFDKMIPAFTLKIPLIINSENKEEQALALRASKKHFH